MRTKEFRVPNITCGHCVMTIQRELGKLEGVASVKGNQNTKTVTLEWDETALSWERVNQVLQEINYAPEGE